MLQDKQLIKDTVFTVFDVETTGLSPKMGDKICEIAALKIKQGKAVDKFYSLVNPLRGIPEEAYNVHHICEEMVKDAPSSPKVLPGFLSFIEGTVLCGYNVGFDISFLENELGSIGLTLDDKLPIVDILKVARKLFPDLASHSLLNLSKSLGVATSQNHRAMDDVELTVKVFGLLIDSLQNGKLINIEDMHNLFGKNLNLINNVNQFKIDQISRAIDEQVSLDIKYFTISSGEVTNRLIRPLEIFEFRNARYISAYCYLRKEKRNFKLDAILEISVVKDPNFTQKR